MYRSKIKIFNSTKKSRFFFGTEEAIIGVDYQSKSLLINIPVSDLYMDPYHRVGPKSPKKPKSGESDDNSTAIDVSVDKVL